MDIIDTTEQDNEGMQRLVGGHDAALNELMERHAGPVFQFLYRWLNDEEEANDLAQETFSRVYKYRERYDGRKFTTWLYTIAANLARSEHRRRGRHPNVSLEAPSGEEGGTLGETLVSGENAPGDRALAEERCQAVREAVAALPTELREAVLLCEWQDLPLEEAATALNTTRKAVESRLYRARQKLREKLTRWLA